MSVKVTKNLKIPICPYRQLCPQTSVGTVKGNHSVSAHSPRPSAIYTLFRSSSVPVKANCKPQHEVHPEHPTCRHSSTAVPGR
jgi:hypothetical protein